MFIKGQTYRRRELHEKFGGQQQGGISTPANHKIILLFTGESGEQHGYSDSWSQYIFFYTGEGQRGDMQFMRGNAAIRDHLKDGKDIHLFAQKEKGQVEYIGQMIYKAFHYKDGLDTDGNHRKMIVFELAPADRKLS